MPKVLLMDEYRPTSQQARLDAITQVVMDVFAAFPMRVIEACIKAANDAIASDMSLIEAMEAAEAVALRSTVSAASALWSEYDHDQNRFHAAMCRAQSLRPSPDAAADNLIKQTRKDK